MNKDIRISVNFFQHHKTKRLKRRLGWEGVIALQQLWCYAGRNKPEGSLTGMDCEDIADVCDWEGEPETFVKSLCEIGFIDQCDEGTYHLHDWAENNPWAANARIRSQKARKAARARHLKKMKDKGDEEHESGTPNACDEHANGMPPASDEQFSRQAPSPAPSPSPTPPLREGEGVLLSELTELQERYIWLASANKNDPPAYRATLRKIAQKQGLDVTQADLEAIKQAQDQQEICSPDVVPWSN